MFDLKIVSVVGYSNSGKTSLIKDISNYLDEEVGVIKHIHEFDKKGKDTSRLIEDADFVVAAAENKIYKIKKSDDSLENSLNELLGSVDYAIIEGYKQSEIPKIALGKEVVDDCNGDSFLVLEENLNFVEYKDEILDFIANEGRERKNYEEIVRKMKENKEISKAGAIGGFTGIVRGNRNGKEVKELYFEKYNEKFDDVIHEIVGELKNREGVIDARIYHRDGHLEVGEDIIYVVVAAEHREELFEALKDGINFVKEKAPIWKKEVLVDGEDWVHDLG